MEATVAAPRLGHDVLIDADQMSEWASKQYLDKYSWKDDEGQPSEVWPDTAYRVVRHVLGTLGYTDRSPEFQRLLQLVAQRKFIPGGRYLATTGRPYHQVNNCFLYKCEDSREGWADLVRKAVLALSSGGGIGAAYSDVRAYGTRLKRTGGMATGPVSPASMVNEVARHVLAGGHRRSAIWGGLHWWHSDIFDWIRAKDWPEEIKQAKAKDYNYPAPLDMTNISVILDSDFFTAYHNAGHPQHEYAQQVYWESTAHMLAHGEPGFSVNTGQNAQEYLRNACTEICSSDDSDVCNLGSINLSRIESKEEMADAVRLGTLFLLGGTLYSDVPHQEVRMVRDKNRRLGLGLMGVHEWLIQRGYGYEVVPELEEWLEIYATSTEYAHSYADRHGLTRPVKTRAIAPNGCQHPATLVSTDQGILELRELGNEEGSQWQRLGVEVAQDHPTTAHATRFYVNGVAQTKRVRLRSGVTMEATCNHQYRVLQNGEYVWRRVDEMQEGDLLVVALNTYHKAVDEALIDVPAYHHNEQQGELPQRMSPSLARFIGMFVGDGSIHTKGIRIACNALAPDDAQEVAELGRLLFGVDPTFEDNGRNCIYVCFNSSRVLRWLYVNGLDKKYSREAEIPMRIRMASRDSVQAFLDGLWFADGSRSSAKYFDTSSSRLAQQLVVVHRAIGMDCTIQHQTSGLGTPMYRVNLIRTQRREATAAVRQQLAERGLGHCTVDPVVSINDSQCMTLDLEVPETTTYVANGVVSHNTIGIVAETTTSAEPVLYSACKRRFLDEGIWKHQFVIDPTTERMREQYGIDPDEIETAFSLADDPERRIKFQADLQRYVDHGISSTINLPRPITDPDWVKHYGDIFMRYLPLLRGFTCYPDGARAGQPFEPVPYEEAKSKAGVTFEDERASQCASGVCGI